MVPQAFSTAEDIHSAVTPTEELKRFESMIKTNVDRYPLLELLHHIEDNEDSYILFESKEMKDRDTGIRCRI